MKKLIPLLLVLSSTSYASENAPSERVFVAALAGPALVTSGSSGTPFSFGGRVGFAIAKSDSAISSLGIAASTMTKTASASGITSQGTITFVGAEYVARKAWGSGLYFGARAGLGLNSVTLSSGTNSVSGSDTVFAFAPVLGYEVPIGSAAIVFDASWLNIGGGKFTLNGTSVAYDPTASVNLHFGVGFGF